MCCSIHLEHPSECPLFLVLSVGTSIFTVCPSPLSRLGTCREYTFYTDVVTDETQTQVLFSEGTLYYSIYIKSLTVLNRAKGSQGSEEVSIRLQYCNGPLRSPTGVSALSSIEPNPNKEFPDPRMSHL